MAWLLLKILADNQNADLISDALMELGALSTSIEDTNADSIDEQAIFGEPGEPPPGIWQQNTITAMFDDNTDADHIMRQLKSSTGHEQLIHTIEMMADQDWVRATQAQFDPIEINDNLWIVPSWHQAPKHDAINIMLDPGLAFGTGSHPTTHLCLEWLAQQTLLGSVLDYGCGSGILAIAAKKLGANKVVGVDIDEQAIAASHYNAGQNHVSLEFFDANAFSNQTFDVVIANILSSALMVLAPALAKYCKTDGKIALSGILETQSDTLISRYSQWFEMESPKQLGGWILLTGTKK